MSAPLHVLLIEDSPTDAKLVTRELQRTARTLHIERVETATAMREALQRASWDLVISDWHLPRFSAPDALALVAELGLDLPFIIVSGTIGEETAVSAMRGGAHDYVLKDRLSRLAPAVERELREHADRERRRRADEALRQSEAQLRQAQKMEMVGRLAGGIAHDFNNVLSVILGYGEMVLRELRPGEPLRDDVQEILMAGRRAADLTRQLLMFSRQQVIAPRVLDLDELLGGMKRMLDRLVGEDVELRTITSATPGRVRVDPGSIEQVIMNLVINARDAMPMGGTITLETASVTLDEAYARAHLGARPGPYVRLSVTDTGSGMDAATLSRIFEPFFTTKEQGKGTGLGLSTVFGIVLQSEGHIHVQSEPGAGTTFEIHLPRVHAQVEELRTSTGPLTLRGAETILLVEDEDQVREVARGILRKHGYVVLDARNAGEALLLCERHPGPIHLLLTDVVMPHLSGPALARRLCADRPEMKVLCMSGYTDDATLRHGVEDAAVAYLQKPITVESLTTKVREVLGA